MNACKTVAKVFLIIGIVTGALLIASCLIMGIGGFVASANPGGVLQQWVDQANKGISSSADKITLEGAQAACITMSAITLSFVFLFIGTLIVSIIGLKQLNKAEHKGDCLAIGILNCIFGINVSGVMLIIVSCMLPKKEEALQ